MSETRNKLVANVTKVTSEVSDFPLVCETCMGDDPLVRMTKMNAGSACQMCERPFTVFRWKAGSKGRFKATVICQLCARLKNVCQCCLLDLEFGLPVAVRDKYLAENEHVSIATSQAGIDFQVQKAALADKGGVLAIESGYSKLADNPHLQRIARTAPYYQRNEARPCSFFQKGECNRGEMCPFKHELVVAGGHNSARDRVIGLNDSVADKLIANHSKTLAAMPQPPADLSVCTLFVSGIPETAPVHEIEAFIRQQFGTTNMTSNLKLIKNNTCAFVEFISREIAQETIFKFFGNLFFDSKTRLRITWAKPKSATSVAATPYPSMDPANVGNAPLPAL